MTEEESELFARLEEEMGYLPCESPQHESSDAHHGNGEWYMTSVCPFCEEGPPRTLICDRYKQLIPALIAITGETVVKCKYCEEYFLSIDIVYRFERRES